MTADQQHSSHTDEALLDAYRRSGDNSWLGLLLQRYTLLLFGVAMKYLKDRNEAQDAVQQVFLKAITHLPAEIANFKGWLYVLMRNHCLQLLRDKTRKAPEPAWEHLSDTTPDKEALQLREYTLEQLQQALQQLNTAQQQCITCFYLHSKSYQQIMERTGYSFAQVKSFIQNGKRNLKLILLKKTGNGQS